jgi:hypothetical protein
MDIPFSRWYLAIVERRFRRYFDKKRPIKTDTLSALDIIEDSDHDTSMTGQGEQG